MKVEQGCTRDPGVLKVVALCRALSISVDELICHAEIAAAREGGVMSHGIVSAGYEGRNIEEFVAELGRMGVRTVADVRLNAISRKRGFSKGKLREALAEAGIEYRHLRDLGNAKDNRQPFWDGRVEEGRRVFRRSLESEAAESCLEELGELARDHVVAVLCFESDALLCHRQVIIDHLVADQPLPVLELTS